MVGKNEFLKGEREEKKKEENRARVLTSPTFTIDLNKDNYLRSHFHFFPPLFLVNPVCERLVVARALALNKRQ
jgi:hypothetical protein